MTAHSTLDQSIAALAAQCGVDVATVQLAADGVARRLTALFGSPAAAAERISDASVCAALSHYRAGIRRAGERAIADPRQIIELLHAGK